MIICLGKEFVIGENINSYRTSLTLRFTKKQHCGIGEIMINKERE